MEKVAFLFPGQGSQYVGMGKDLYERYPQVRDIFNQSDEVCGFSIAKLCFEGPLEELTKTVYLQPAITTLNLAILTLVRERGIVPRFCAGHSLGEYSALACAGVLSLGDCLAAVKKRGELMEREATRYPGAMAAVMGMDKERLSQIIEDVKGEKALSIANYNSPDQIVITGDKEAVDHAISEIKKHRGKAIPLKVSGAWHSSLMEGALHDFRGFLEGLKFSPPQYEVVFNLTGLPESDPERIRDLMVDQLVNPVKWQHSIEYMERQGVDVFLEIGPKNVLSGLVKKTISKDGVRILNIEDLNTLNSALDTLTT